MSAENEASDCFSPLTIDEKAIEYATKWLQIRLYSPDMQETEIEKLKNHNPDLFIYLNNLGFLRSMIQFDNDHQTRRAYWNGAFYMLKALESQNELLWREPEDIRDASRSAYFLELIDIEINHYQINGLNPDIIEKGMYFSDLISAFLTGYRQKKEFDELSLVFAINSQQKSQSMLNSRPHLRKSLTGKPTCDTHGPTVGLYYGALDIYEPYRIQRENNLWNEKHEIPTK